MAAAKLMRDVVGALIGCCVLLVVGFSWFFMPLAMLYIIVKGFWLVLKAITGASW